ncbi:MAG TPA: S1 family peptidase, partial [Mycobacteriales bacterium]|nr:S1 family peptidase [Mycobacteriales bacterium]
MAAGIAATGALALPAGSASAAPVPSGGAAVQPAESAALAAATGVDTATATARVAAQGDQARLATKISTQLGATKGAGSYLDAKTGALVVNVTDAAAARTVTAAGAQARVVSRSRAQLDTITAALNKAPATPGTAWGIDPKANQVVVTISSSAPAARAATLEATATKYGAAVRVQRTKAGFEPKVQGGDAILTDTGGRCSAGFNTTGGLVTAGHCTAGFPNWTVSGGGFLGTSADSQFPGNDFGLISNTGQPASGSVNLYNGTSQPITGAADAVAGQSICKSGSTTGLTCGTVQATNVTVTYAEGQVFQTVQTDTCVQPGDSGGSWFSGSTAFGLTSGGTIGGCGAGFQSFYQPVTEALAAYGVSL